MFKTERKKSLYFGYFIKYFAIFLIPMFIMTFLLYRGVVIKIKQDIEDSYRNKLRFSMDDIDNTYQKLSDLALLMQFNSDLNVKKLTGTTIEKIRGIEQLNRYKSENTEIEDIFVFYKNSDQVFSQDGVTTMKNLQIFNKKISGWSNFLNDISSREQSRVVFFPNEENKGALSLAFIYNVKSITYNTPEMTIVFIISNNSIVEQIRKQHDGTGSNIYIYAGDTKRWLSIESSDIEDNILDEIIKSYRTGKNMLSYSSKSGENFSVVSLISPVTGMEYVSIVSNNDLMHQFYITRNTVVFIVILLIASGIAVAFVFSSNSYLPIKRLYNSVNKLKQKQKPSSTNEIDFIQEIINDVLTKNSDLRHKSSQQKAYVQKQALTDIVKRRYPDEERLVQLAQDSQLYLNGKYYWVIVMANYMTIDLEDANEDCFDIEVFVNNYLESKKIGYAFEMLHVKQIVGVVFTNENPNNMQEFMINFAKRLKEDFDREFGTDVLIGVGKHSSCLLQLNKSYIDALGALEFGSDKADSRSIRMVSDTANKSCNLSMYPVKLLADYINSLKQGDAILALDTLSAMFSQVVYNVKFSVVLKLVCFDIVNAVIKTVLKLDDDDFEDEINYIASFNSTEELKYRLEKFTVKYCNMVESREKNNDNALFASVMNFINNHYTDNNMSLSMVADKFGKTNYFISRFIKSRLGCNFFDYLTRLRVDKAKQLLVETDSNLNEIAAWIGYNNVQSFIINFKKIQGVNPSPFRRSKKAKTT